MPSLLELSASPRIVFIGAQGQIPNRFLVPPVFSSVLVTICSLLMILVVPVLDAKALPDIYWNSSNPIFRIDNTEHVFMVKIHDRVDFVCPFYTTSAMGDQADIEVMEIYSVSKWAYDYCALTPDSVVVGVCNNPFQRTYATVVFREYTPKPGGLEFKPGHSYYFISTSTGQPSGLQNKHGGLCSTKNMKVKFEVEAIDSPDSSASKSGDGFAAGGVMAQTKPPRKGVDDDSYDEQYQMASSNGGQVDIDSSLVKPGNSIVAGSSRTHDNSRELKKQNASGGSAQGIDVTTPRLYEIHTRPEGDFIDVKRTDYKEHYGSNAQHRRNSASITRSSWRKSFVSLLCSYSLYIFVKLAVS